MLRNFRFLLLCACSAALLGCATSKPLVSNLVYSDDGLSEIAAPDHWQTHPSLGRNADIRLADVEGDNYLLVNTYLPDDLEPMSFEEFGELVTDAIADNLDNSEISTPRRFTIGDRPAIEYQISTAVDHMGIVYLSTVVEGRQARYHLVGWTLAGSSLAPLRQVVTAFRESDGKRAAKERVDLEFNWPAHLTSTGTFHHKSTKRGVVFELRGEVASAVKPVGEDQLLISSRVTSQTMSTSNEVGDKDKDAYLQTVLKAALTDMPDYVIDIDGGFMRIENLTSYHKRIQDTLIEGLPKGDPQTADKAKELVQTLLPEQMLAALMEDEWNNKAGNWTGNSYAVGEKYEFTVSYQAPALGNRTFPMVMTQQLAGYVPCHTGAAASSCVRLLQSSRVSGAEFTKATNQIVQKTVGRDFTISSTEAVTELELITDPMTLLPYLTHTKQIKRVTVEAGGKSETTEEVEESSATYRYVQNVSSKEGIGPN
jgi:hypothetical protein